MTFLKKFGELVLKATGLVKTFGPIVKGFTPDAVDKQIDVAVAKVDDIAGVVLQVEAVGQALGIKGPDKLKAAAPLIAQVILSSGIMVGKTVANPTLFQQGCTKIGDGMADVLNSLHESGVEPS